MPRRNLLLIGVLLAALVVALLAVVREDEPAGFAAARDRASEVESSVPVGPSVRTDVPPGPTAGPEAAPEPNEIRVEDAIDGTPISGALLLHATGAEQRVSADRAIATGGESGVIEVRGVHPEVTGASFYVWGEGYLPRVLESLQSQTVRLDRGHSILVGVRGPRGEGVEGALVGLAPIGAGSVPFDMLAREIESRSGGAPGPSAENAIVAGRSDAAGEAQLSGLAAGRYFVGAVHDTHVAVGFEVGGSDGKAGVPVPGSSVTVQMHPVCAAVFDFGSDQLVSHTHALPRAQVNSRANPGASLGARRLRAAHPDGLVIVGVPSAQCLESGAYPELEVRFLTRDAGWSSVKAVLRPLAEVRPIVIESAAVSDPVCRPVQILLEPPLPEVSGFPQPWLGIGGKFEGRHVGVVPRVGEVFHLPPGSFGISESPPFLREAVELPTELQVGEGQPSVRVWRRSGHLTPCRLDFRIAATGAALTSVGRVRVVHESGTELGLPYWTAHADERAPAITAEQWIPPGRVTVHAVLGRTQVEVEFTIPATADVQVLRVEFP